MLFRSPCLPKCSAIVIGCEREEEEKEKSSGKGGFAKITLTLLIEFRQRRDGRKEGKKEVEKRARQERVHVSAIEKAFD